MNFIREALTNVRRLDDDNQQMSLDLPDDDQVNDPRDDVQDTDQYDLDLDDDNDQADNPDDIDQSTDPDVDDDPDLNDVADQATQDPDRMGLIRTVKSAHLVYKRESEEGTFEELWIYNIDSLKMQMSTKKAILAGTDIPAHQTTSPDGSQSYEIWSAGNAEMLLIKGLPS